MVQPKTVLITGAGGYWGTRLAARLASVPDLHVIGLDTTAPREGVKGLDFVQTDVRNPLLADFLREEKVQAVCHLAFVESNRRSEGELRSECNGCDEGFWRLHRGRREHGRVPEQHSHLWRTPG